MSLDTAKAAIDFLCICSRRRRKLIISFVGGGEPLLNFPIIKQTVEYCEQISKKNKKKFYYQVITNGTLLDEEICHFLSDMNFMVIVSMDGDENAHNANRKFKSGKGSFAVVLQNIRRLKNIFSSSGNAHKIGIRATMTNDYHDPIRIHNFFSNLGLDRVVVSTEQQTVDDDDADTFKIMEHIYKQTTYMTQNIVDKKEGNRTLTKHESNCVKELASLPAIKDHNALGSSCGVGRNAIVVDTNGLIFPCHRYLGMNAFCLGNIVDGIDAVRVASFFDNLRSVYKNTCNLCWGKRFCQGPCPWTLSRPDGSLQEIDNKYCSLVLKEAERNFWFGYSINSLKINDSSILNR